MVSFSYSQEYENEEGENMSNEFKKYERILKGAANHRRIEMLRLLKSQPELSLAEISESLKINLKTASEHLRRLALSGLIMKRYDGSFVRHKVSAVGEKILTFLRMLE